MNNKTTVEGNKVLEPLIRFTQANTGTVARVRERMTQLTGHKVHRQMVESWLHLDPAKRIEPRFSTGLALLKVWEELKAAKEVKKLVSKAEQKLSHGH